MDKADKAMRDKIHRIVDQLLDDSFAKSKKMKTSVASLVIGIQSHLTDGTYGYSLSSTENKIDFMPYIVFPATTFTAVASYAKNIIDKNGLPDSDRGRIISLMKGSIMPAIDDGENIIYERAPHEVEGADASATGAVS